MSSYSPDESSADLFNEKMWLHGAVLCTVAYGVVLTLFSMCFYLLVKGMTRSSYKRSLFFLVYISVEFILATLFEGSLAKYVQLAFIEDRNFPGGPGAYEAAMFSIPVDEIGNVAFVLTNWLSDGLVVWRCLVIYSSCGVPMWVVMALPFLLLLASVGTGLLWLIQISATSPFSSSTVNWTIPYLSLSLALNILVTIAIVIRLWVYRRRISGVFDANHGSQYTSIAAMLVESAFIYSSFSILFLVPFGMNIPLSELFLQALSEIQTISTMLIVFRTAQGKVWTTATQREVTACVSKPSTRAIQFSNRQTESGLSSQTAGKMVSHGTVYDEELKGANISI
ncbi:hypothetical protein B0H14DRAFT_1027016 [Mycena olivaceomarginata]|nr:hypothetical protein B0H14DRAFT_1027016 [Mycena olivaceomarginata]